MQMKQSLSEWHALLQRLGVKVWRCSTDYLSFVWRQGSPGKAVPLSCAANCNCSLDASPSSAYTPQAAAKLRPLLPRRMPRPLAAEEGGVPRLPSGGVGCGWRGAAAGGGFGRSHCSSHARWVCSPCCAAVNALLLAHRPPQLLRLLLYVSRLPFAYLYFSS